MNKKGFTLIELLAVIVILGIIMLIAVPSISGVITNSRKDAFIRTAESYVDAASKAMISGTVAAPIKGQSIMIGISGLELENANHSSPFGSSLDTTQSFVKITNVSTDEKVIYEYEITLKDESSNCIPLTKIENLTREKVTTNCSTVEMDNSNANVPELVEGMIAVTYDETTKNWIKADTSTQWYSYDNQKWANAVTVSETNRSNYMSADPGTVISMDDINTMWVWIPRYEYQYTNLGDQYAGGTQDLPGEIKINFVRSNVTTPSDKSTYKIHPAFTFGTKELSGFWYAKFETTGTLTNTCTNNNCDVSSVSIKPGTAALTNQNTSSFFYMSRSMQLNNSSIYGFNSTSSMDLHMSKNSEWGAVAYLSQSKYGKYGNSNYEGTNKEIYQNKSASFIAGSSNGTPSTDVTNIQVTYDTPDTGYGASTTGTIYGIYDMSGGSHEYVMGILADNNKLPRSGYDANSNSGFNGTLYNGTQYTEGVAYPDAKYYDLYTAASALTACDGGICYGHALSETSGWYNDFTGFIVNNNPVFMRGGARSANINIGIFQATYGGGGGADAGCSARLTLTP